MIDVSLERFEQLVAAAVDEIPDDLSRHIENVAIVVEDYPPHDQPNLLGLYEGVPLTSRGTWYVAAMPDRIRIFRIPILRMCQTQAQVVREVHVTVIHEIAHHFGISDETLHQLGAY